jgi:hypothetical protein
MTQLTTTSTKYGQDLSHDLMLVKGKIDISGKKIVTGGGFRPVGRW